jgi:membrane protein required for colicin V production
MSLSELPLIDGIALTVLLIAAVRGLWIGLIREGLSLAAIAAATIVTRLWVDPAAAKLTELSAGEISGKAALWIAGVVLVVVTILVVGAIGRLLRRGAVFAGLGWADRVGGGVLGATEGAVVAAILVLLALWLVGPEHPVTARARSVELVERMQTWREDGELPAVAAPGSWR